MVYLRSGCIRMYVRSGDNYVQIVFVCAVKPKGGEINCEKCRKTSESRRNFLWLAGTQLFDSGQKIFRRQEINFGEKIPAQSWLMV